LYQTGLANLEKFRGLIGFRKSTHLGVRFINRVDIPIKPNQELQIDQYLRAFPLLPEIFHNKTMEQFFIVSQFQWSTNARVILQVGSADPQLINHASFVVDIDAIWAGEIPQAVEAAAAALLDLRHIKNEVFEACIGESARALFSRSPLDVSKNSDACTASP
jgi:uncharacterized protein (TIGR04255 family)